MYGHFELARLLIEAGAEIEGKTRNGYTALHLAAQYGHRLIIDLLLEHGANPNAMTNVSIVDELLVRGLSLSQMCCWSSRNASVSSVALRFR